MPGGELLLRHGLIWISRPVKPAKNGNTFQSSQIWIRAKRATKQRQNQYRSGGKADGGKTRKRQGSLPIRFINHRRRSNQCRYKIGFR
jgi:hypothetical protein